MHFLGDLLEAGDQEASAITSAGLYGFRHGVGCTY